MKILVGFSYYIIDLQNVLEEYFKKSPSSRRIIRNLCNAYSYIVQGLPLWL